MIETAKPVFCSSKGESILSEFESLAEVSKFSLSQDKHYELSQALNSAHLLLKEIGVVPDAMDTMISNCKRLGASAAKITGAGGGGTILCLLDKRFADEQAARIRQFFADYPSYRISI